MNRIQWGDDDIIIRNIKSSETRGEEKTSFKKRWKVPKSLYF